MIETMVIHFNQEFNLVAESNRNTTLISVGPKEEGVGREGATRSGYPWDSSSPLGC